jgi:hypothetical protein
MPRAKKTEDDDKSWRPSSRNRAAKRSVEEENKQKTRPKQMKVTADALEELKKEMKKRFDAQSNQIQSVANDFKSIKSAVQNCQPTQQVIIINTDEKTKRKLELKLSQNSKFEEIDYLRDEVVIIEKKKNENVVDAKPKVLRKFRPMLHPLMIQKPAQTVTTKIKEAETSTKDAKNSTKEAEKDAEIEIPQKDAEIPVENFSNDFLEISPARSPPIPVPSTSKVTSTSLSKFHNLNSWMGRKKPTWTVKNSSALSQMLTKEGLISTYKCLSKHCSFTTISEQNFETHLGLHVDDPSDSLFYCPYCFFKGVSSNDLINHCKTIHNHDKYQCGYCFYRSVAAQACWEHVKTHHEKSPTFIYECPLEKVKIDEMTRLRLESKRKQMVLGLKCTSEFLFSFFS